MRKEFIYIFLSGFSLCSFSQSGQIEIPRIEKMPFIPQPYEMRDWKQVTKDYISIVLNNGEGEHMPLSSQNRGGVNYPEYNPIYIDTYVGWNSHNKGSEAINAMPAVVSAYLTDSKSLSSYDLATGILDFYNLKNKELVYLNNFSSKSGGDWWYDVMPNVYFYQLYHLTEDLPASIKKEQFVSVAEQWLDAVKCLGGNTFLWQKPYMNYRAFDLISKQPLKTGVTEPESAGSIAWILYNAYIETRDERYLKGAELAMDFMNSLTSNPSYELQLAYGVQAAAKMNAIEGTDYNIEKMFNWCFDRGPLRGWGCIVGNWGGYDVSGLIGEANDRGDDYAFVMNGFQQAAALAPAVKYDKRFARAYARWLLNLANASRLFYVNALPKENQENASYEWGNKYDLNSSIPFESIKEKWEGKTPFAMGDAVKGKWAETNLSLYSGSSVGYLAAVVDKTDVDAILQIDLNSTDTDGKDKNVTWLYYNPYDSEKNVSVQLPSGNWKIYDTITENFLSENASGIFELNIPSDEVRMLVLVPVGAEIKEYGRTLFADDMVIDYHYKYDYKETLRIRNLEMQNFYVVKGTTASVRATLNDDSGNIEYKWMIDNEPVNKLSYAFDFIADMDLGEHMIKLIATKGEEVCSDSVSFVILDKAVNAPVIDVIDVAEEMPVSQSSLLNISVKLVDESLPADFVWTSDKGEIISDNKQKSIELKVPDIECICKVTCHASNIKGETEEDFFILVKDLEAGGDILPLRYFSFDNSLIDSVSNSVFLQNSSGQISYVAGYSGRPASAVQLSGNYLYLDNSDELNFSDAIALSFWIKPEKKNGKEQFIVSHGSWQDRYKVSINPDMTLRWTVKTENEVMDLDYDIPVTVNQFSHFACLYTGYSIELYHNGTLYSYKPLSSPICSTDENLTVGSMTMSEQNYNFLGVIDELYLFDSSLTPAQIKLLYNNGIEAGLEQTMNDVNFVLDNRKVLFSEKVNDSCIYTLNGIEVANGNLPNGIYLVKYKINEKVFVEKIFVH